MRLIDADELIEDLQGSMFYADSIPYVEEQPTAYDLDAVIKKLEEQTELAYKRYIDCPLNSPAYDRYATQYRERKECLEIVKAGIYDN